MVLAYEKNTSLAFDTGILQECANEYQEIAGELRNMAKDLSDCLLSLKEDGWTTPAGTAFYEMTKTNWADNIEKYASLLETLSNILKKSAESYDGLMEDYVRTTKVK